MKSKQRACLLSMVAFTLMSTLAVAAEETNITKGVGYLTATQGEDGSWNTDAKKKPVDSQESFLTLQRVSGGENALNNSLKYFSALETQTVESLAIKLQILSSSTSDVTELAQLLIARQKNDGGWGLIDSKNSSVPHTILAINALLASKKASSGVLSKACTFLASSQRTSGEWIFASEDSLSDIAHTAMTLVVLKQIQATGLFSSTELEQAITRARNYLEGKNSAGSYGELLDTAWTYLAFSQIKQPSELQNTLTLITNSQKANGSWSDQIYDTAICLRALAAIQIPQTDLPDLEITEPNISFNPAAPLTGNEVTVTATVFNTGKLDAENVKVEFFNRDPRLDGTAIGAVQTISLLPAGGSAVVKTSFPTTGMVGAEQIVVFVDRDNTINEVTKTNNAAAKTLNVGGIPDLAISAEDITLSNPNPKAFENVDLIVTIHNTGNVAVQNIPVKIYDNDQLLSEFILSGVNANSTNKGIITTGFSAETHNIRVELDPAHTIAVEVNLANNTATKSFTVEAEPKKPVDLVVLSISTDPAAPLSTEPTKFVVTAANLGGQDVTAAFAVTLNVDGNAVGTINVPQLLKGQKAVLSFENISLAAGERTVSAVADSGNVVAADTERANNTLTKTITVRDASTPGAIEVVSFTATPATTTVGGTVLFKMTVKNTGTQAANNVNVNLLNGTASIGSANIPALAGGQTGELQFEYAFSTNGSYTIRAVATLGDKTTEKSVAVNVTGASDLEITAAGIVLSSNAVTAFQQFEITANIKNIGNMDAVNVPVRFLANGEILATMNLSGVSAGSSNKATLKTSLPTGSYNITISLDPDRTLTNEHNLLNNTAYKTLAVAAPITTQADVAITSLLIDPVLPIQNTPVNLVATVVNLGGTDIVAPFVVEFKDGETVLHSFTVPNLAAGQKSELKLTANLSAGEHTLAVIADSANAITEETKANNSLSKQVTVASDATPADLTVASVILDKSAPNVQDKIVATAAIYNAGTTAAENFFVRVMVNGTALGEDYKINSLPGGGTFNLQIPYTVAKEGENTIQIIADAQNNVEEGNETNNTGNVSFTASTVARPDLTIPDGGLATSPENPQPTIAFEYKITVANTGNENAPASKLIVSDGNPQMAGAVRLAEADIPAIEAGKQAVVSVNLKLDANKENIFILLDSDELIAESNEGNNLFKTSIAIKALPDLRVTANDITLSHTDISQGNMISIKVMVCNAGSVDSTASQMLVYRGESSAADKVLLATLDVPVLSPGATFEGTALWNALPGDQKISAIVDPENKIVEASEANNTAVKAITIEGAKPSIVKMFTVPTDGSGRVEKYIYGTYQDVEIELTHFWGEGSKPYLFVLNETGGIYSVSQINGKYYWNTGDAAPGNYRVRLQIVSAEMSYQMGDKSGIYIQQASLLEERYLNFQVTSDGKIVKVTKINNSPTYSFEGKTETIKVEGELLNYSNVDQNIVAIRRLKSPTGEILQTENFNFLLTPKDVRKSLALGNIEQTFTVDGTYKIEVEIQENGVKLAELSSDFTVLNNANITVKRQVVPDKITPQGNRRVKVVIELDAVEQTQGN